AQTPEDALAALAEGMKRRETAKTDMNHNSSRSHLIFTLTATQKDPEIGATLRGRLHLVDLAGSERLKRSMSTDFQSPRGASVSESRIFGALRLDATCGGARWPGASPDVAVAGQATLQRELMGVHRELGHWNAYQELLKRLPALLEQGRRDGHDVDADPMLTLDVPGLLRRYLIAEDWNVDKAEQRLQSTISFRRKWQILEYYKPGAAKHLYEEASNPGSEMYFADSLHKDLQGRPYMVGRVDLCNGEQMHPWRHLRAGIFALDRLAIKVIHSRAGYGSYLLDIGKVNMRGTVSGSGGGGMTPKESNNRYYKEGAGRHCSDELLADFGELSGGLAVLRAALTIASEHYPELLSRIVFLNADLMFSLVFKIFRLWAHKRTRDKFLFLGGKADPPLEQLFEWYDPSELPEEFGGTGWRLDTDAFMARAIPALDEEGTRGWHPKPEVASDFLVAEAEGEGSAGEETASLFGCFAPLACCLPQQQPRKGQRRNVPQTAAVDAGVACSPTTRRPVPIQLMLRVAVVTLSFLLGLQALYRITDASAPLSLN
ncbi:unnamed protein product, partial [Effrenium voratum]